MKQLLHLRTPYDERIRRTKTGFAERRELAQRRIGYRRALSDARERVRNSMSTLDCTCGHPKHLHDGKGCVWLTRNGHLCPCTAYQLAFTKSDLFGETHG